MYEYMANGSLKDHLHNSNPLSWRTRIQIAIDVANALEYLHFYCDPPLCHRDIKSSNILLDENFFAKVADFSLAHASKDGSICFEPVNTDVRGTPGRKSCPLVNDLHCFNQYLSLTFFPRFMDPEYVITQELTEKSNVYSYGVLLLEMNLVEWSQTYLTSTLRIPELVDPRIKDTFDFDQLQTIVSIVQRCTQPEGRARPSVKQILRLLYETSDPVHSGFLQTDEEGEFGGCAGQGRASKGKMHKNDAVFNSSDVRYLVSSSSTSRSHGSRSFLLESGSPQSPPNMLSL
ncbi:hypothetical protein EUGRSUZ_G01424 [Eucalyptus grandis]|uniref:Protein kinase domain-containing protein n=2 Tax=Eucalyptus grandis TaxID=71139 RepID=A0A059BC14_EUCGR|nr:hypothetical protein EUGRSUZ_G01424 [Eucalyptus grandis]